MEKKRLIGITIFSSYLVFAGLIGFSSMIEIIRRGIYFKATHPDVTGLGLGRHHVLVFIYFPFIIGGIFTFFRRNWARKLLVAMCSLLCVDSIYYTYSAMSWRKVDWMEYILVSTVTIFPIIFFTRPKVKEQFK